MLLLVVAAASSHLMSIEIQTSEGLPITGIHFCRSFIMILIKVVHGLMKCTV